MTLDANHGRKQIGSAASLCLLLFTLAALASGSCAIYRAERLPEVQAVAPPQVLDAPRLRATVEELHRTTRPPIPIDLSDGLNPDEAAVLAVLLNPDLVAARDVHGEEQAQVMIAGILPNPVFGLGVDQPFGPNSTGMKTSANLSLGVDLKPYMARSARQRAAEAGLEQIDLGIAWQEWQVAEEARLLVVRLGWVRKRLKLAQDELDFAEQSAHSMVSAGRAGDTTIEQIGVARAAVEGVRRTLNQLEQTEAETESALRALLGNPELPTVDVANSSDLDDGAAAAPNVAACLQGRLDLAALRRGYQAGEERLRAAVLDQFPAVTIGVAYQRNEVALNFIGGFINLALPIFDHNQHQVDLGIATRRRLRHEYDARVASTRGDLDRLVRFSTLVTRQAADAHRSIAPLEKLESQERAAVARGDLDRVPYQIVRSALFDQRLQEAVVSQALAETRVGIESACGGEQGKRP